MIDESEMLRTNLRRQVGRRERIDAELEIGGRDSVADARSLNLDGLRDERRVSRRSAERPGPGTRFAVDPDLEDDVGSIVRTQVDAEKRAIPNVGPGIVRLVTHPFVCVGGTRGSGAGQDGAKGDRRRQGRG